MNYRLLSKYLGMVCLMLGGSMFFSLPWGFPAFGGGETLETRACLSLVGSIAVSLGLGAMLTFFGRRAEGQLYRKEAMATVGLSWVLAALLGALPFLLSQTHRSGDVVMTIADAIFESASGFTGTGATVITDLEDPALVPRAILFWRSETHFLGGLGTLGAVENYSHFQATSKFLFVFLMMLGRLEIYPFLVLFIPRFWRSR